MEGVGEAGRLLCCGEKAKCTKKLSDRPPKSEHSATLSHTA